MTVAITGANGFLGSHLVRKFLEENFKVFALVRQSANMVLLPDHPNLTTFIVDYSSDSALAASLEALLKEAGKINYLLHNAGVTVSQKSSDYFKFNSTLTKNLIDGVKSTSMLEENGRFIYVSSFAAHGPTGFNRPVSDYGRSKKMAEELLKESNLPSVIVRPTAIYGEGDSAFLPLFNMASKGIYPCLTPLNQKLTFIHAKDLASIIYQSRDTSEIIHASDGQVYTHEEVMSIYQEIAGRKIRKLKIPSPLVKIGLWTAGLFYYLFNIKPEMTLEKYNELSHDWNLNENSTLRQAEISNPISLSEGFRNTFAHYKEKSLIK